MMLSIDTSDQRLVHLKLDRFTHTFETDYNLSEKLVPEIQKFLKKQKIPLTKIKRIEVFAGPGHFSRIRTAVATANALIYALRLPQGIVKPVYDRAPHITKPKQNKSFSPSRTQ